VVCSNTAASKLVHDYIAGFQRQNEDGTEGQLEFGRLPLFRNHDEEGRLLARPRTLLIDSSQLESGDALNSSFRQMAADEIERFRREIVERTGDRRRAENLSDQDLLREVMNTVGRKDCLGESVRCVVSVSMLNEGWDANNVTHVLGVRAFGTQLLCEQVIGRALRRQSYVLNEEGLFDVEYADVFGIPFDFTAKPTVAPPQPPRRTVQVKAVRPERDHLEISFPRVAGYRADLPEDRLTAAFNADSVLELTPDLTGATKTLNAGIIGKSVDLDLAHTGSIRSAQLAYELAAHLLLTKWRDANGEPQLHLFGQLKRIARQWLEKCLRCTGGTYPAQLKYKTLTDMACERIFAAITRSSLDSGQVRAVLDPYNPAGSSSHVRFSTSKQNLWQTDSRRCQINWAVLDSDWEAEFCRAAEAHPRVRAYVKNHNLGFEVPYRFGSDLRKYLPDFIVLVDDGGEEPLHLIVEIKGRRQEDAKEKKSALETFWVPGVNSLGRYGRWASAEFTEVHEIEGNFAAKVEAEFNRMIEAAAEQTAAFDCPGNGKHSERTAEHGTES
jgi:type III restriction enzyme